MTKQVSIIVSKNPKVANRSKQTLNKFSESLSFNPVPESLSTKDKIPLCKNSKVIILTYPEISTELVKACPSLGLIQTLSAGFDRIDIPTILDSGIKISNNTSAICPSVAEHALSLIFSIYRQLDSTTLRATGGTWNENLDKWKFHELAGKTVGIIGLGHIGQTVAKRLQGFDNNLLYFDPTDIPAEIVANLNIKKSSLEALLASSDIVTIHCPLNEFTHKLISQKELSIMKQSAILINTSRGPVVDEKALYQALKQGDIAGAGLDVLEEEPPLPDTPLRLLDNVVITPHTAGTSYNVWERTIDFAIENTKRFLDGNQPLSLINP